jgi:hypothetical protein
VTIPLRLCVLTSAVCVVYTFVAVVAPGVAQALVVPCVALIVVPSLTYNVRRFQRAPSRNGTAAPRRERVGL